jgi:hypothetical protein
VASTPRRSRANTGKRVVKGAMHNKAHIMMRSPACTSSVRQLNVHPLTRLWQKEPPCVARPRPLVVALGSGRSHRVQTIASR